MKNLSILEPQIEKHYAYKKQTCIVFHSIPGCDVPVNDIVNYGFDCVDVEACLNNNKPYYSLVEAWKMCGKVEECGFVMRYKDSKYYLRSLSDAHKITEAGVWGYIYKECGEFNIICIISLF